MRERFARVTTELLDERRAHGGRARRDQRRSVCEPRPGDGIPRACINVGIREQLMVGVAGGLALEGMRPIAHTYAPFLVERPFEQIKLDLGHQDVGAVLVSIGASYDGAERAARISRPATSRCWRRCRTGRSRCPGIPTRPSVLLRRAAVSEERVYIRLSERSNAASSTPTGESRSSVAAPPGTVLAVGPMLDSDARGDARPRCHAPYASTVRPLDEATLRATFAGEAIVLVEPTLAGTSTAPVSRAFSDVPTASSGSACRTPSSVATARRPSTTRRTGSTRLGLRASITTFLEANG